MLDPIRIAIMQKNFRVTTMSNFGNICLDTSSTFEEVKCNEFKIIICFYVTSPVMYIIRKAVIIILSK